MIDIKLVRENPELVKESLKKRGVKLDIDKLLDLDRRNRELIQIQDNLKAEHNKLSKQIAQKKTEELMGLSAKNKEKIADAENKQKVIAEELNSLMLKIPNLIARDVPVGKDEADNKVVREWGRKPKFNFEPKNYLSLSEPALIDIERAAKVSGSRFGYLKGPLAQLEFALVNFVFSELSKEGFVALVPPVLIKKEMMQGMGYINSLKDEQESYFLDKDDLFLVGTSEQSVGPMHAGEILKEEELPKRYVAFSTCFRREAGSYGKDTKGILRVHQFDKIEMFSFVRPENSWQEHDLLLSLEERLVQVLRIPYRVVRLCSGDLSAPSASTYDIESWMPGQSQYRETHSTSNTTDYQARRLNIRFRRKEGEVEFVHTLNGTALAIGRILVAILENYQQKDGSIEIPKNLHKYLPFKNIEPR